MHMVGMPCDVMHMVRMPSALRHPPCEKCYAYCVMHIAYVGIRACCVCSYPSCIVCIYSNTSYIRMSSAMRHPPCVCTYENTLYESTSRSAPNKSAAKHQDLLHASASPYNCAQFSCAISGAARPLSECGAVGEGASVGPGAQGQ